MEAKPAEKSHFARGSIEGVKHAAEQAADGAKHVAEGALHVAGGIGHFVKNSMTYNTTMEKACPGATTEEKAAAHAAAQRKLEEERAAKEEKHHTAADVAKKVGHFVQEAITMPHRGDALQGKH